MISALAHLTFAEGWVLVAALVVGLLLGGAAVAGLFRAAFRTRRR
jgi:hypothetical protein